MDLKILEVKIILKSIAFNLAISRGKNCVLILIPMEFLLKHIKISLFERFSVYIFCYRKALFY